MIFRTPQQDLPAAQERARLRALGDPKDAASGTLRLSLHLSEREYAELCELNPDTLGIKGDDVLMNLYWKAFCEAPESKPFRVRERV